MNEAHSIKSLTKSNELGDHASLNASVNTDHAKFMKKIEARNINCVFNDKALLKPKVMSDFRFLNGIDRILRTIGFSFGSLVLLAKVKFKMMQMSYYLYNVYRFQNSFITLISQKVVNMLNFH